MAYEGAVKSGRLDRQATELARLFAHQDQEHADALLVALEALGATRPAPPAADARNILARPTTQRGFARLAIALELQAVAAYHDAQFKLSDPDLRLLSAHIMANQGQHLAVLRQLAGEPPVPHAFERGVA
jgi:hypothetical protein